MEIFFSGEHKRIYYFVTLFMIRCIYTHCYGVYILIYNFWTLVSSLLILVINVCVVARLTTLGFSVVFFINSYFEKFKSFSIGTRVEKKNSQSSCN